MNKKDLVVKLTISMVFALVSTALYADNAPAPPGNVSFDQTTTSIVLTPSAGSTRYTIYDSSHNDYANGNATPGQLVSVSMVAYADGSDNPGVYMVTDSNSAGESSAVDVNVLPHNPSNPTTEPLSFTTSTLPAEISLSWQPQDTQDSYAIRRSDNSGDWQIIAQVSTPYYIDTNVNPGHQYSYLVIPQNAKLTYQNQQAIVMPNFPTPVAPTGLKITELTDIAAGFSWQPGANTAYTKVSFASQFKDFTQVVNGSLNVLSDNTLQPYTAYDITLQACNGAICTDPTPVTPLNFQTYESGWPENPSSFQAYFTKINNVQGQQDSALVATWNVAKNDDWCAEPNTPGVSIPYNGGTFEAANYFLILNKQDYSSAAAIYLPMSDVTQTATGCQLSVPLSSNIVNNGQLMTLGSLIGNGKEETYTLAEMDAGAKSGTYRFDNMALNNDEVMLTSPYYPPSTPENFQVTLRIPGAYQLTWSPGENDSAYQIERSLNNGPWQTIVSQYSGESLNDQLPDVSDQVSYRIAGVNGPLVSSYIRRTPNNLDSNTVQSIVLNNGTSTIGEIFANNQSEIILDPTLCSNSSGSCVPIDPTTDASDYANIQYFVQEGSVNVPTASFNQLSLLPVNQATGYNAYVPYNPQNQDSSQNPAFRYLISNVTGQYKVIAEVTTQSGATYYSSPFTVDVFQQPQITITSHPADLTDKNGNDTGYATFPYAATSLAFEFKATENNLSISGDTIQNAQTANIQDQIANSSVQFLSRADNSSVTVDNSKVSDGVGNNAFSLTVNNFPILQVPQDGTLLVNVTDEYGDQFQYNMPYHNTYPQGYQVFNNGTDSLYAVLEPSFYIHPIFGEEGVEMLADFYAPTGSIQTLQYEEYSDYQNGNNDWENVSSTERTDFHADDYMVKGTFNDGQSFGPTHIYSGLINIPSDTQWWTAFLQDTGSAGGQIGRFCDDYAILDAPVDPNNPAAYNCSTTNP